ncbi:MAG: TM0106 family RecB-like putative nuclease [Propionicimonas sp.]|uniref:TM0106 family RecB-like putative nuclease n=1 Tax=Propionicimonas sp. TaxID=1955623 RepID=UPI002B1F8569|nr:TM0106 family RecB-like putative nuclease [Propionicimonas sp.]MEA4943770.1 TM0106 family RecB-like putative nuclease [Propionicimonas sp.]
MALLHSHAARSCPVRTQNEFHPGLSLPPRTEPFVPRVPQAQELVEQAYQSILGGTGRVVDLRVLRGEPTGVQREAGVAAMTSGAAVIVGGLLPADLAGHRVGRPHLLVRDPDGGYVPGLVRGFRQLDQRRDDTTATISRLDDLGTREQVRGYRFRWQYRWRYALQLAHYYRILQACGQAPASGAWGLVVGTDELDDLAQPAVWVDLEEPVVGLGGGQVADGDTEATTALARYDFEFAGRLAIAEQAEASDPSAPPAMLPVVSRECGGCAWWPVCEPRLDPDDLSLRISRSPLDVFEITVLRQAGVWTVNDLVDADLDALLPDYLARITHRKGAEERLRLAQHRSRLVRDGIELERVNPAPVELPTAGLEIDLDIETSAEGRVYLWGFWLDDPAGEPHYRQFSDFRELDDAAELALAHQAMTWLRARTDGTDARIYHYSDYELRAIARLARAGDDPMLGWAVEYARAHFVDLFPIVRQHFFGTNGLGLKVVAHVGAGFSWRDPDPGGLNSMQWFADAVGGQTAELRSQARTRVLEYNEDDVRATWQVRRWLRSLDTPVGDDGSSSPG